MRRIPFTPRARRRPARRLRTTLGALAGATALLASAAAVTAAPAAAAPAGAEGGSQAQQGSSAAEFWTAERMRAAEPLDVLKSGKQAGKQAGKQLTEQVRKAVPGGEKLTVPPSRGGAADAKGFPETGGSWTGGGAVEQTTGRVFFTYDGQQASCSGNAVTSDNASTVITAGHCVKMAGKWHTDWVFVPGYHDGQAPYGKWSATETLTTPQWDASEDMNYDVGAAVVAPLDGKKLTDVVGGQGLAFNSEYNQDMYAFGYPAADPYDGEKLTYCSGTTFRDVLLSDDHGMSCDMTGGSSGGPWYTEFDESTGTGLQASVNSFGYTFLPDTMFGPHFGADAQALYEKAQTS